MYKIISSLSRYVYPIAHSIEHLVSITCSCVELVSMSNVGGEVDQWGWSCAPRSRASTVGLESWPTTREARRGGTPGPQIRRTSLPPSRPCLPLPGRPTSLRLPSIAVLAREQQRAHEVPTKLTWWLAACREGRGRSSRGGRWPTMLAQGRRSSLTRARRQSW